MNRAYVVFSVLALAVASVGCIKPPEIVMVDRATALEQQASGTFDDVELRLNRSAIEPRPVPLTPEQLAALGLRTSSRSDDVDLTDSDRIDGLLLQHCMGEGTEGLLVDTHAQCEGAADADEVAELIDRVNRARRQLWRWMHEQRASASVDDLRRGWREAHVRGVVCGGWIEEVDGTWQGKTC